MEVENPGLANLRSTEKRAGSEGRKAETKSMITSLALQTTLRRVILVVTYMCMPTLNLR